MAGNEYFPTRPREAQDRTRIAAGSPLAVLGILLEGLRERFNEEANLGIVWRDDVQTTDIIIEAGYNTEIEARDSGRALYVNRLATTANSVVLNNLAGVDLPSSKEGYLCMMVSPITIDCISNDAGDSTILADIVQHFCIASRKIFEGWYGIHDMSLAEMGQTLPFEHDQSKWSTTVGFRLMYQVRWSAVKIRPLLQDTAVYLQDSAGAERFATVAMASLQRSTQAVPTLTPPAARTSYEHVQDVPALQWTIRHGLGVYPAFVVVNSARFAVTPVSVQHETRDTAILTFAAPTAGTARAF